MTGIDRKYRLKKPQNQRRREENRSDSASLDTLHCRV